eukprot:TRINITY_DN4956_c0_g1_i3.p1 TRINITY_DN4956_c0_g1~~TRINITY_DN4956_c0_g1_i3.p1  ORF type:complete len:582 (+),score=94.30 TRINITY_DN4956_c0_g1_i3:1012-2757(+)
MYAVVDHISIINTLFWCNSAGIGDYGDVGSAGVWIQGNKGYGIITANVSDNSVGTYGSGTYWTPGSTCFGPSGGITESNNVQGAPVPFSSNCGITAFPFLPASQSPSTSSSPSSTPSGSPSPSSTPSGSPSPSLTPSASPSSTISITPSSSASSSRSASPSGSASPSSSTSPNPSKFPSPSVTPSTSSSRSVSSSSSRSPSCSVSPSPSITPSNSVSPSVSQSASASPSPSPPIAVQNVTYSPDIPQTSLTNTIGNVSDSTLMTFTLASNSNSNKTNDNNSTTTVVTQLLSNTTWTITKKQVNSSQEIQDGVKVATSDGAPIDTTTWHASVGNVLNVTTSALYSSLTTSANVSLGSSNSATNKTSKPLLNYQLIPGSVKYTIAMTGSAELATAFPDGIQWNGCVNSSQNLGLFSPNYTRTLVNGQMYYTWKRDQASLQLAVPMQGLADNTVVNVTHELRSVAIDDQGLRACFLWYFPQFQRSLLYDPTVESLFASPSTSASANPDTSGGSNSNSANSMVLKIAIPVAIGGAVAAIALLLLAGLAAAVLVRRRQMHRRQSALNQELHSQTSHALWDHQSNPS